MWRMSKLWQILVSSRHVQKIWTTADTWTCPRYGYQRASIKRYLQSDGKLCSQQRTNRAERLAGGERVKGDVTSSSLLWVDVPHSLCKTKHRLAHALDNKSILHWTERACRRVSFTLSLFTWWLMVSVDTCNNLNHLRHRYVALCYNPFFSKSQKNYKPALSLIKPRVSRRSAHFVKPVNRLSWIKLTHTLCLCCLHAGYHISHSCAWQSGHFSHWYLL